MSEPTEAAFTYGGAADAAPTNGHTSVLERLKQDSAETLAKTTQLWPVPVRAGFDVSYCLYLPKHDWKLLQAVHGDDEESMTAAVLTKQCRGLWMDGKPESSDDGTPLTFLAGMQPMLGAESAADAVRKLYIREGDAERTAFAVIRACGLDMRAPLDPTVR